MSGPLVPVPTAFPVDFGVHQERVSISVASDGLTLAFRGMAGHGDVRLDLDEAPAFCAAVLSAAHATTHRVIDLGGELPEVHRDGKAWSLAPAARGWHDEVPAESMMDEVRLALAVLQARAATPKHDPDEIALVAAHLREADDGEAFFPLDHYATAAVQLLDALAAARAKRADS